MTLGPDELTPTKNETTLDLVLKRLNEVGADARDAKEYSRRTNDLQLELNERFNKLERRVAVVEVTQAWPAVIALAALALAVLAVVRAW